MNTSIEDHPRFNLLEAKHNKNAINLLICNTCGKKYKHNKSYIKHIGLCSIYDKVRNKNTYKINNDFDDIVIPSYNDLFKIVQELIVKTNKLENELNNIKSQSRKFEAKQTSLGFIIKNTKDNILEKLNNMDNNPNDTVNGLINNIAICDIPNNKFNTLNYLYENTMNDTIYHILKYNISLYQHIDYDNNTDTLIIHKNTKNTKNIICPIYFNNETNTLYVYVYDHSINKNIWVIMSKSIIQDLVDKSLDCIFNSIKKWESCNRSNIINSLSLTMNYMESIHKITDFNTFTYVNNINLKSLLKCVNK
jgi:uncharacterized C2H2 Zn-finger protein